MAEQIRGKDLFVPDIIKKNRILIRWSGVCLQVYGVEVDLVFASLPTPQVQPDLDLLDDAILDRVDPKSVLR